MLTFQIKGIDKLIASMKDINQRQVPFALAKGMTDTIKDAQAALVHEMKDSFDRPTPFTLSSTYVIPATKQRPEAHVFIKNFAGKSIPASKYLMPQIEGGTRRHKRFERALRAVGALPDGYSVVPGGGVQLDAHGNMDSRLIVQLLSYFKAFPEMGYRANMTDKRREALAKGSRNKGAAGVVYFVGRPGGGRSPLGVWARYALGHGSAVKPILIFVPEARYEKRFDFFYTAQKAIEMNYEKNLVAAWGLAIRTAKK